MSASPAATTSAETYGETIVVDPQFVSNFREPPYIVTNVLFNRKLATRTPIIKLDRKLQCLKSLGVSVY